jgi:signal peptidase I
MRSDARSERRSTRSGTARRFLAIAFYAAAAAVALLLWPQTLGGRVTYVMVSGDSMLPTMHIGDVAVMMRRGGYDVGDVVAFRVPKSEVGAGAQVIHRIVGGDGRRGYVTRGDHNDYRDPWRPTDGDIVGERITVIPRAGWVFSRMQGPLPLALFAAVLVVVACSARPGRTRRAPQPGASGPSVSASDDPRVREWRNLALGPWWFDEPVSPAGAARAA